DQLFDQRHPFLFHVGMPIFNRHFASPVRRIRPPAGGQQRGENQQNRRQRHRRSLHATPSKNVFGPKKTQRLGSEVDSRTINRQGKVTGAIGSSGCSIICSRV